MYCEKYKKQIVLALSITSIIYFKVFHKDIFGMLTGTGSTFLYGYNPIVLKLLRIICMLLISTTNYYYILINPLFLANIISESSDILFLTPVICFFDSRFAKFFIILCTVLRQYLISSTPGINLYWLINTHFLPDFLPHLHLSLILFEFMAFSATIGYEYCLPLYLVYLVFDPAGDWISYAFLMQLLYRNSNLYIIKLAFTILITGIVFNQSSFYAWWTVGVGNANFTMVGSLICAISCIICYVKFANLQIEEKPKESNNIVMK